MNIYSIKNEKMNFFNRPIYCESSNEAMTYLQNVLMSDADRALIGLKDDLALYELGKVDFVTGEIKGYKKPELVCSLRTVFDTIPEDKIPRTERYFKEQIELLKESISKLTNERSVIDEKYEDLC